VFAEALSLTSLAVLDDWKRQDVIIVQCSKVVNESISRDVPSSVESVVFVGTASASCESGKWKRGCDE
jgi:hypothetical protein